LLEQLGFQFAQASFGCSDQVQNGRITLTHFFKDFVGGHPAVMPHAGLRRIERHPRSERAFIDAA
jgi:ureidoglycolate hydrolase